MSNKLDESKITNLQLTIGDVLDLIEILNFASQATNIVCSKELEYGNIKEAARLNKQLDNCKRLSEILRLNTSIGEPPDGEYH